MECVREGQTSRHGQCSTTRIATQQVKRDVYSGDGQLVRQRVLNRIDFSQFPGAQSGRSDSPGSRQTNPIESSRFFPEF